jgi:hypothetical protein
VDADAKTHERWHKNEWIPIQKRMNAGTRTSGCQYKNAWMPRQKRVEAELFGEISDSPGAPGES